MLLTQWAVDIACVIFMYLYKYIYCKNHTRTERGALYQLDFFPLESYLFRHLEDIDQVNCKLIWGSSNETKIQIIGTCNDFHASLLQSTKHVIYLPYYILSTLKGFTCWTLTMWVFNHRPNVTNLIFQCRNKVCILLLLRAGIIIILMVIIGKPIHWYLSFNYQ